MNLENKTNNDINSFLISHQHYQHPGGSSTANDEDRNRKMQQLVESLIGDNAKQQILHILEKIAQLNPPERLLLYLRMPGGTPETDPLRQPQNPLGTRSEINHTINWVRSHLEHDPNVSIPKQDVYDDYVSYCSRVNIKPLSTADFGKVMKQVFPEIRPRRLGTRGHSRYCYAAMRKATKLEPPRLPDLRPQNSIDSGTAFDDDSWRVVKTWAETLLGSNFDSAKELADHITKRVSLSPGSVTATSGSASGMSARNPLQKKMLQREMKERKKLETSIQKSKRRKKRSCATNSPEGGVATTAVYPAGQSRTTSPILIENIKTEIDTDECSNPATVTSTIVTASTNFDGTNSACDNVVDRKNIIGGGVSGGSGLLMTVGNLSHQPTGLPITITPVVTSATNASSLSTNQYRESEILMGKELPIICKKVRQAQQSKGLWAPDYQNNNNNTIGGGLSNNNNNEMTFLAENIPQSTQISLKDDTEFSYPFRKIGKYAQPSVATSSGPDMSTSSGPNSPINLNINDNEKQMQQQQQEVIGNDFKIPRERVISICNLDKDALDDYLNGGDNSQEQEAELLQYFQNKHQSAAAAHAAAAAVRQATAAATAAAVTQSSSTRENLSVDSQSTAPLPPPHNSSIPLLENYQLMSETNKLKMLNNNNGEGGMNDKISQLRTYLQQNLPNNWQKQSMNSNNASSGPPASRADGVGDDDDEQMGSNIPSEVNVATNQNVYSNATIQNPNNYSSGSASASLTLLSQRHNNKTSSNSRVSSAKGPKRKLNLNITSATSAANVVNQANPIVQSPNSRLRNLNFVPISPGPQSPQVRKTGPTVNQQNLFISPSSGTQVHKSRTINRNNLLPNPLSLYMPPHTDNMFSNVQIKSEISASAPPSPVNQTNMYNNPGNYQFATSGGMSQNPNNSMGGVGGGPHSYGMENRSQSVPLHCRSPAFGSSTMDYGFATTCNSVAQTPIPSEFSDFNNSNILDMFTSTDPNPNMASVKMESNDFIPPLENSSIIPELDFRTSYNQISRSVPSTPLPILSGSYGNCSSSSSGGGGGGNGGGSNQMRSFDNSKSVPTTPITVSGAPFRYSPDTNRDFLINGNSMDRGKLSSFFQQQQQQGQQQTSTNQLIDKELAIPEEIDDLANFDDQIIGSDLLNNL